MKCQIRCRYSVVARVGIRPAQRELHEAYHNDKRDGICKLHAFFDIVLLTYCCSR